MIRGYNRINSEGICFSATSSTINSILNHSGLNKGLHGEKPPSTRLSNDTTETTFLFRRLLNDALGVETIQRRMVGWYVNGDELERI
jgi:hypothetical protein